MEVDSSEIERSDLDADSEVLSFYLTPITLEPHMKLSCVVSQVEDAMKNGLKRSSSAPLINQLVAEPESSASILQSSSSSRRSRPAQYVPAAATSRWRRWSTSTTVSPVSPGSPMGSQGGGLARLNRIRSEETGDLVGREIQTERDVQRGLNIENSLSQSWEDLSLVTCPVSHYVISVLNIFLLSE